mmetsp:Transcript_35406/g.111412  ORF Transcript_35406/g.111412 Transcript_35406/m.111412 type:complete len:342 (+) Transcript_35406:215-1240(+)
MLARIRQSSVSSWIEMLPMLSTMASAILSGAESRPVATESMSPSPIVSPGDSTFRSMAISAAMPSSEPPCSADPTAAAAAAMPFRDPPPPPSASLASMLTHSLSAGMPGAESLPRSMAYAAWITRLLVASSRPPNWPSMSISKLTLFSELLLLTEGAVSAEMSPLLLTRLRASPVNTSRSSAAFGSGVSADSSMRTPPSLSLRSLRYRAGSGAEPCDEKMLMELRLFRVPRPRECESPLVRNARSCGFPTPSSVFTRVVFHRGASTTSSATSFPPPWPTSSRRFWIISCSSLVSASAAKRDLRRISSSSARFAASRIVRCTSAWLRKVGRLGGGGRAAAAC